MVWVMLEILHEDFVRRWWFEKSGCLVTWGRFFKHVSHFSAPENNYIEGFFPWKWTKCLFFYGNVDRPWKTQLGSIPRVVPFVWEKTWGHNLHSCEHPKCGDWEWAIRAEPRNLRVPASPMPPNTGNKALFMLLRPWLGGWLAYSWRKGWWFPWKIPMVWRWV